MPLVITGHTRGVDAVVAGALPDGSAPATISGSDTVRVWRTADGGPGSGHEPVAAEHMTRCARTLSVQHSARACGPRKGDMPTVPTV